MLGLYGGTFDPIHYGHLRTALDVKEAIGLHVIRLVPCRQPPHREEPTASAAQRLRMLRLAVEDEPAFDVDTRELDRPGPSYMVDTLAAVRREIGEQPLCLIVGMDAFLGMSGWHRWPELFRLAHVVVMQRPGCSGKPQEPLASEVGTRWTDSPKTLTHSPAGKVYLQDVTPLHISATRIREIIAQGGNARYLLPDSVLRYILEEGLYRRR